MEIESTTPLPEELLGHPLWIRRLARELAGDAFAADDLAQDAWVAVLDRPPREPGPIGPWLRGVLRRLALQRAREEARRTRRERERARAEALPDTAELVARADLQRRIAAAVVALSEPHRTAVLLRYFEGLSAAEIARRQGVPAATVRSRLARGLAELRRELDRSEPGGRAAWAGLVFGWLGGDAAAKSVAVIGGLLAMKGMLLTGAAAAALLCIWLGWRNAEPEPPDVVPLGSTPELAREEDHATATAEAERTLAPLPEAPAVPAASEQTASVAGTALQPPTFVEARLVDEHGSPLAGGVLAARRPPAEARSGSEGMVRLELALPASEGQLLVEAQFPGRATAYVQTRVVSGSTKFLGDITLAPAGSIAGRVVDSTGAALAGIEVVASALLLATNDPDELRRHGPAPPLRAEVPLPSSESARDGSFRIEGVPVGPALAWGGGSGFAWSSVGPLEVRAGETLEEIEIVLEELDASDVIEGLVLAPNGEPIPAAIVRYQLRAADYSQSSVVRAGADGRFHLLLAQRVPHDFQAADPEGRWSEVAARGVEPGTRELVLQFQDAHWIEVRALRDGGARVAEYSVVARRWADPGFWQETGERATPAAEASAARLRAPTVEFQVVVDAPGFALATLGPFDPTDVPAELEAVLEELPGLRGRVLADDEPVAGARVQLERCWAENVVYVSEGFRTLVESDPASSTRTDAQGRFALDLREPGHYVLRAEHGDRAVAELGPIELDPRAGARDLELVFVPGGAVEGRYETADGSDPTGRVIAVNHGDGRPRTVSVGGDGRYRFENLAPGMWQVFARESEADRASRTSSITTASTPVPMEWSCEVFSGETTWYDVAERASECAIDGRLVLGGAPCADWTASLRPRTEAGATPSPSSAVLDAEGRFQLSSTRAGAHELVLRSPASERSGLELRQPLELRAGSLPWSFELPAGSVTGEGAQVSDGIETLLELRWRSQDAPPLECRARIVPDEHGRFSLPLVPAGDATIHAYAPASPGESAARWIERATLRVPEGGSAHAVLR